MTRVKIYTGLSLDPARAAALLPGAEIAGPAARGDVTADLAAGVAVVVLIDGRFQQSLAVSPGELLDALRAGLRIYGASSMGAMRAVELRAHGMIGHGAIHAWIASEPAFRDDFLGQVFVAGRGREASMPYVDLRFAVRGLAAAGAISAALAERIDETYRALHFAERDLPTLRLALTRAATSEGLGARHDDAVAALAQIAAYPRQKELDAEGALRRVATDLAEIARLNERLVDGQKETRRLPLLDPPPDMGVSITL